MGIAGDDPIEIGDWDRDAVWSSGTITPDIEALIGAAASSLWGRRANPLQVEKGLKKLGDIAGCPIPDRLAARDGYREAILYLASLIQDYNIVRELLVTEDVRWAPEWGKEEKRPRDEPPGEDASRIPEDVGRKNLVRGPGNYHEYSITRLLWTNKNQNDLDQRIDRQELKDLVLHANSVMDLQTRLIASLAERRLKSGVGMRQIVGDILPGTCHQGFFRQNNPYSRVSEVLKELQRKYENREWFEPLRKEVDRILASCLTNCS